MAYSQTFERADVKTATQQLILDNAEHLIKYIYDNKDKHPYDDPARRVGLALKTLLKLNTDGQPINGDVLEPVIEELQELKDRTKDALQQNIYDEELRFLKCCTIHSDMVTLNTVRN